jgi:hypothetical protein
MFLKKSTISILRVELKQARCLLLVVCDCLLGLLFDPEDGDNTFLGNVGKLLPDCMA